MKNNSNSEKLTLKFKNDSDLRETKVSNETIQNSTQDLDSILSKLKETQNKIRKCNSIEDLNKIEDLIRISSDLGLIIQNSVVIEELDFKKRIEETNQLYRDTEILYFNKKFELLNKKMEETFKKSEDRFKDITGGTLFSIASVFLGISLTSALVTGVQYVGQDFIILYFMTCILIAVVTIGLSALFMRKADKKSLIIVFIIVLVSIFWIIIALLSYHTHISEDVAETNNDSVNLNCKDLYTRKS